MKINIKALSLLITTALFFNITSPVNTVMATEISVEQTTRIENSIEETSSERITDKTEITTVETTSDEERTSVEEVTTEQEITTTDPETTSTEETTTPEETTTTSEQYIVSNLSPAKSKVVILDAGHCGIHPGAQGHGLKEEVITLDIAKACRDQLNKYDGITVYMTRTTGSCCKDTELGGCLVARNNYAELRFADFLVSMHINADASSSVSGAMVLAAYQSGYNDNVRVETQALGNLILKNLNSLGIKNLGFWLRQSSSSRYPNGARADYYSIVRNGVKANIPSLIIEHGYITNTSDCKNYFKTEKKKKKLGVADANAIISYYGLEKRAITGSFVKEKKKTYYITKNGLKVKGWMKDNGKWYYFSEKDGQMQTGFITVGKNKFYLNPSTGEMTVGWFTVNGKTYFAKGNGIIIKNKISKIVNSKYYFKASGVRKTGWVTYKNKKYYFNKKTGKMVTGWKKIKGKYYYFKANGKLTKKKWKKKKK